jgi:hypothetical protein
LKLSPSGGNKKVGLRPLHGATRNRAKLEYIPVTPQKQGRRLNPSDSAIISQAAEDVLDNVQSGSFCDSEEIRVAFFLAAEAL